MDPDSPDGRQSARERAVLLTLAAVQFTSIVDFMVVMPLGSRLMRELHIGHAIVSRALFVGFREAVAEMKRLIREAARGH